MGHMHATEYASGEHCDFDTGLVLHLQSNHYPPVSVDFVPTCKEAIEVILDGNAGHEITMPNGKTLTASKIVEGLHLDPFLQAAFFAQDNPCDNCEEIWGGGMDCADCPHHWKSEAKASGYFVTIMLHQYMHQPDATSGAEALGQAQDSFEEDYGEEPLASASFKVREAGNPEYIDLEEEAKSE